ncbi:MAG: tetratricopeptide repeat protein [Bryobacteraceae bacterium]|nr:tetratricopeptide repeat protein [Bryobacteraceae bacterium]
MRYGRFSKAIIGLAGATGLLFAQAQPQPKSQKEVEAIQAMFQAQDPDSQIKAAENLIQKFADTDFKALAMFVMANAYQNKNDPENTIIWAERMLEIDKTSYQAGQAMLMIAKSLAVRTREFDLDKEEKLGRAEKLAKEAQNVIAKAPKPRPDISDEQWEAAKKDGVSLSHEALGLIAQVRKNHDVAIAEFTQAVEMAAQPDPGVMFRLASSYASAGKNNEALSTLDKVLSMPNLHPTIKSLAEKEKARIQGGK